MRVGKINTFGGANDLSSTLSNVPIPDNANYTTVFKYSPTGYYYERLSTGVIRKITCCQNELSFLGNISEVALAAPVVTTISNDFAAAVPSYVGVGIYDISFANANFAVGTTTVEIQQPTPGIGFASARVQNASTIRVRTYDSTFVAADGILDGQALRITRQD